MLIKRKILCQDSLLRSISFCMTAISIMLFSLFTDININDLGGYIICIGKWGVVVGIEMISIAISEARE